MKVGLKDVAKASGVTLATVSRALKDDPRISEGTRQRVWLAAKSLGYESRGGGSFNVAGVIVPELTSDYYAQIVHMATDAFAAQKFATVTQVSNFSQETMLHAIRTMGRIHVRCLLVVVDSAEEVSPQIIEAVTRIRTPVVFITSRYFPDLDFDCLFVDEQRGVAAAIEHLMQRGYRRIGFIGEEMTMGRYRVYLEKMRELGLPVDARFVAVGRERGERGGLLRMQELLRQEERPDALVAGYDQIAIGALHAMEQRGLSAPGDIALIGFDDSTVAAYVQKGLTTIRNPLDDMVSIAVRVLMGRLRNPDRAPQQVALKPMLVVRGTT